MVMVTNGMHVEMRGRTLYVNGVEWGPKGGDSTPATPQVPQTVVLDKDGNFTGDIHGDLILQGANLHVTISGNVDGNVTAEGNVTCGSVGGSVHVAGGNVECRSIGGSVQASGDVSCRSVGGSVTAMGMVNR